jgi:hypothetical protein
MKIKAEKKSLIKIYPQPNGKEFHVFWCPACKETHTFVVGGKRDWVKKGSKKKPSYFPSLSYQNCHLVLRQGVIEYLLDSRHFLRGLQTLMVPF